MPAELEIVQAEPTSALKRACWDSYLSPMDDMWAAFAAQATPYTLLREGRALGFCSVDDEQGLRTFYLDPAWEDQAPVVFEALLEEQGIAAAFPATTDPAFLSLCLDRARGVEVKALLFEHVQGSRLAAARRLATLRLAQETDSAAVLAFEEAATGAPLAFLEGYVATRIAQRELLLHEDSGRLAGVGELRPDVTNPEVAHLGVIVGEGQRRQGLGSAILDYLVGEAKERGLRPICSTEPSNLGARRAIERVGFRTRHRVLRVEFADSALPPA